MISFGEHFENALSFINENRSLADCHLVDFITGNLWKECLSYSLRQELESIELMEHGRTGSQQHIKKFAAASSELKDFISRANSLCLKNGQSIAALDHTRTIATESKDNDDAKKHSAKFMSNKKQHEIEFLAKLIGRLAEENEASLVIDAGAGKGYLSTGISERFGIPVLAVDSSRSHRTSAIRRQEIIKKKSHRKTPLIQYSIQHIDEQTDYEQLVRSNFADWSAKENFILTGLHTCGQLAHSMIKNFLSTDCLKSLCVVPCCYHLTEESLTGRCSLTKNARMIAQQSAERSQSREDEPHPPSLYYRALLQVVLESLGKCIADTRIGRGAPTRDFPSYAQWALRKIGVNSERIPSSETLAELYNSHLDFRWKFNVFQSMRVHLGSVIESAIVLDRVLYLQESDRCSKVALTRLFDPLISPRCYAITASK